MEAKQETINVLLVEDHPGDARLVREMLKDVGYPAFRVRHFERLNPALDLLSKERFDVVLLDLLLEDRPRLGALMEIHSLASKIPTIVLTGLEDQTVGLWVRKEGAQDYLIKGKIDAYTLVRSIHYAIQGHKG